MRASPRMLFLAAALMSAAVNGARSQQIVDPFGQTIAPDVNAAVDQAKTLRLPYDKTPEKAKSDAATAVKTLEAIVAAKPDYYRGLFNLGLAYDQAGDFAKANETFEKAIELRRTLGVKDISLLNSAGWVSLQNGDYATAEKRLLLALENINQGAPFTQSAVYNNLGQLYFFTQRFDEARKYLTIAKIKFASKSAADTLDLIDKTNAIIQGQQQLAK
jgi:Tfp pilus assembly protein PilF